MLRWLKGRGARAAEVAQMQARIAPELWRQVLDTHPCLLYTSFVDCIGSNSVFCWDERPAKITGDIQYYRT